MLLGFIKKFSLGLLSVCKIWSFHESLVSNSKKKKKCVSLNNHRCQDRPTLGNINSNEILFVNINSNKTPHFYNIFLILNLEKPGIKMYYKNEN